MGRRQFSTCYDHCSAGRRILNLCDYAWIPDVAVAVSRHSANLVTILVADACWHLNRPTSGLLQRTAMQPKRSVAGNCQGVSIRPEADHGGQDKQSLRSIKRGAAARRFRVQQAPLSD